MKRISLVILSVACLAAAPQKPERGYVLGPGDQVLLQVVELPEFGSHPYRVDNDGGVGLPLVGRIRASGLTLEQFESKLTETLKKQVIEPHVVASIAEPRSQPVSVIGSVNNPGTRQVQGPTTLFDAIAGAGG